MEFPIEYWTAPIRCRNYLAERLFDGSLALLLGAGASEALGLPSWSKLIRYCFEHLEIPAEELSSDLELAATRVSRVCQSSGVDLRDVLEIGLYGKARKSPIDRGPSRRMAAIGAMLTGSRRGSVSDVVTFNYDSVVEDYLVVHGYVVSSVSRLPRMLGTPDVKVYHPHGYLPSLVGPGRRSGADEIVFTKQSALRMLSDTAGPWPSLIRTIVRSKVILIVGVSTSTTLGSLIGPMLASEAEELKQTRPSAFWLSDQRPDVDTEAVMLDANIAPVALGSLESIDDFLLDVCREAGMRVVKFFGKMG